MIQETLIDLGGAAGAILASSLAASRTYLSAKRHGKPKDKRESWSTEKWLINLAVSVVIGIPLFALGIATNQQDAIIWLTWTTGPVALGVQKLVDIYQRTGDITRDQFEETVYATIEDLLGSEDSPLRGLFASVVEDAIDRRLEDEDSPLTTEPTGTSGNGGVSTSAESAERARTSVDDLQSFVALTPYPDLQKVAGELGSDIDGSGNGGTDKLRPQLMDYAAEHPGALKRAFETADLNRHPVELRSSLSSETSSQDNPQPSS